MRSRMGNEGFIHKGGSLFASIQAGRPLDRHRLADRAENSSSSFKPEKPGTLMVTVKPGDWDLRL